MPTSPTAALVTVAVGSTYREYAELTHDTFRSYAARFGLDFVVIDEHLAEGEPHFAKFSCFDLLDRYERLIFVDTDALIAPGCPNLLEIVPEDGFGAYLVSRDTDFHDEAIELVQQRLRDLGWRKSYFNTGVMVISRSHRWIFDPADPDYEVYLQASRDWGLYWDQTYINYKVYEREVPVHDLGYTFNHSLGPGKSDERFASHIIHCKGHHPGGKLTEIRRAKFVLDHPMLRRSLARYPALTRLYDKI